MDKYDKFAELRPADTNEAQLYYVPLYTQLVGFLQVHNQDASTRTYRVALENADNPCGSAGADSWIAYDKDILGELSHRIGPLSLSGGQCIKVKASVADKIDFVLTGLLISTKEKSIVAQMNISDGVDKYRVASWANILKWPIIYLHHDDTYQRLIVLAAYNTSGDKWAYNIVVIDTSLTTWAIETVITDTTDPALLDKSVNSYYIWWNSNHAYGLNLVWGNSWLGNDNRVVGLFNYYYDPMILYFNFEGYSVCDKESNINITWGSSTMLNYGNLVGVFYEGTPYETFKQNADYSYVYNNKIWVAFMSGATGAYYIQIGYIDVNNPKKLVSSTPVAFYVPYIGDALQLLASIASGETEDIYWDFNTFCYGGGVFDTKPVYTADAVCLYVKPDEGYVVLTGQAIGTSSGFCLVFDYDGNLLKDYINSTYPDFPIWGCMSPVIKNGILYAGVYNYNSAETTKKGMIVINLTTDAITYKTPGYICQTNYQLRDLKLINDETQILMASYVDGFLVYDIASDAWAIYNDDNTEDLFPSPSSDNELFCVTSDDTRQILIGAPTGTTSDWGGITALKLEDIDMTDNYDKLASLRPADTSENELYEVPADTEIVGMLYVCNQDTVTRTYSVALTDTSGAAGNDEWIRKTVDLLAGLTHRIGPISLAEGKTVRVQAGTANVISFVLTGLKITQ